jgi:hypothetical protein
MRRVLIAGFLAVGTTLVLSLQAFSQSTGATTGTNPAHPVIPLPQPGPGFAAGGEAPVGHRQPTAKDVPQNENSTIDVIDKFDKELNRKLTICRGC